MRSKITSLHPLTGLYLVLLHISFIKADGGDEFSNNFATDLAPLLALFGENVAKQFMAGSMGWTDNIIFAMAPLGIITAIVGAIRVSGRPKWLKSVIGRAREGRGNVEIELMSSTSVDVCEMWDGQSVVRVLGSSSVIELILGRADLYIDSIEEYFGIFSFAEAIRTGTIRRLDDLTKLDANFIEVNTFEKSPPNISLNIFSKRGSRRELHAVAVFGTGVQIAVIALAGLETYIDPWNLSFKKNGHPVDSYAFPLMVIGTSLLVLGMVMCSHIIEASSIEVEWMPSDGQLVWMQKGETINDQKFKSFAFFGQKGRPLQKSIRDTKNDRESQVLIATVVSIVGFVVQFSALRFLHWSITVCQLTAIAIMTGLRAVVRRNLADEPIAEPMPDGFELDWMSKRLNACKLWKPIPLKEVPPVFESPNSGLATAVVNSRNRLRTISNWAGRHQKTAESLTAAIEALMNFAFTDKALLREPATWSSKDTFEWAITVEVMPTKSDSGSTESTTENVLFKLERRRLDGSRWSLWQAESNDIEAVLGLWMLHIDEVLEKKPAIVEERKFRTLIHMSNANDEFGLWILPGLKDYFACPTENRSERKERKKRELVFDAVVEPKYQSEEFRFIYDSTAAHNICAQIIFSTFLSQIAPHWSPMKNTSIHYGTKRKLDSFRLMSQTVMTIAEILERFGLATIDNAYVSIVSALQTCQALPKSTDPATLLSLLRGIKQQEDNGERDEADDAALWLSHQVEMASRSYRTNGAWKDAGSVYWDYYAACRKVCTSSPRTEDAARRMGRFEAIACSSEDSGLLKSEEWTAVKNTSKAYKMPFQRQRRSISPSMSDIWSPLWKAVVEGDVPSLAALLEGNNTGIDARGRDGWTPLIHASYEGFDAAVELLISKKAALNAKDDKDRTSLHHAIENKHSGVVELLLLGNTETLFEVDRAGRTPLSIAMMTEDAKLIKMLNFYDVNDIGRSNAWRGAIEKGNRELVQQLVKKGIEPDSRDESGRTPLSWATAEGHASVVELLLTEGADIEAKDRWNKTALIWAADKGHTNVVELLLVKGADIEAKDRSIKTALIWAAEKGHAHVVELLLTKGADIEAKDEWKQTALIRATLNNHLSVVELLLAENPSVEAKDNQGRTTLIWATILDHASIVELLLDKGVNVNTKDDSHRTALSYALERNHTAVIELLEGIS